MDVFSGDLHPENPEPSGCAALSSLLSLLPKIAGVVWTTDLELRLTALTGAGLRSLRISPSACTGKPIGILFAGPQQKPLEAHRRAAQGQSCSFHAAIEGQQIEAHVEPLLGPGGKVAGVLGVALEGTGRAAAERALRLSEQNYRLLIEDAPYAICRTSANGQILQANRAMMEMLGYEPESESALLERELPSIFVSPERFEELRGKLAGGKTVQGVETTWVGRGGNPVEVRIGGRAVRDSGGGIICLDILSEDITERKRLEARLSQAQRMQAVGQLAGGVAHDFNNLLTVIGGQIEMALNQPLEGDLRQRLEDVRQAAERAAGLTRQLLAFSRGQVLQSKILDVNPLIGQLTGLLTRLIRENIELNFLPGRDLGLVRADPNQIEQVLLNLVVNAQDAMAAGGKLTIETSAVEIRGASAAAAGGENAAPAGSLEPGQYVLISVHDTGHGMDPQTQARIFEPFFTTKKTGEGTGLGLATVYGVVQQSGGQIHVESQVGMGSTFRIYLPRAAGEETAPHEPAAGVSLGGHETILLAEDERWVRKLVAAHLAELGYRVLAASDGAEALELARAHSGSIDLLLSDLVMPRIDGRQLAGELRGADPRLKVIFVSGYAGNLAEGQDFGAQGACFLPKPFTLQLLARTVREVLDV
ncbi:MAG TPA: ATP-binding protein [Bryobacteraceae bacterium]|nr:ATP-binding protein [Bryobacteraceae bacterium]